MACFLFIFIYVRDELSYDKFHQDADDIYQVIAHSDIRNNSVTPVPPGPVLKENFPEIIGFYRYHWIWGETILSYEDKTFTENDIRLVDPFHLNN